MMNEEYNNDRQEGFPVDLTEQEYLAFNMTIARKMGALRTQSPIMILFAVYFVIDVVSLVKEYLDTGEFSVSLAIIALVTLASAIMSMTAMPAEYPPAPPVYVVERSPPFAPHASNLYRPRTLMLTVPFTPPPSRW